MEKFGSTVACSRSYHNFYHKDSISCLNPTNSAIDSSDSPNVTLQNLPPFPLDNSLTPNKRTRLLSEDNDCMSFPSNNASDHESTLISPISDQTNSNIFGLSNDSGVSFTNLPLSSRSQTNFDFESNCPNENDKINYVS